MQMAIIQIYIVIRFSWGPASTMEKSTQHRKATQWFQRSNFQCFVYTKMHYLLYSRSYTNATKFLHSGFKMKECLLTYIFMLNLIIIYLLFFLIYIISIYVLLFDSLVRLLLFNMGLKLKTLNPCQSVFIIFSKTSVTQVRCRQLTTTILNYYE